jgi:hypothetical protein
MGAGASGAAKSLRYQRRTERVDEAILGVYLSGTNTRLLRGSPRPAVAWRAVVEGCGVAPDGAAAGRPSRCGRSGISAN